MKSEKWKIRKCKSLYNIIICFRYADQVTIADELLVEGNDELVFGLPTRLDCTACVNYLGTKVTDMALVTMTEFNVLSPQVWLTECLHSERTGRSVRVDSPSPRMLNVAFIVLNDFMKLEDIKPACSWPCMPWLFWVGGCNVLCSKETLVTAMPANPIISVLLA